MPQLTLAEWGNVAQVVATILTAIGVGVSVWIAVRTLGELEKDRILRSRPYLVFESRGELIPVIFEKVAPYLQGESVEIAIGQDDSGGEKHIFFGQLKNHGAGPAIETSVTWVPTSVWIGEEKFMIDSAKLEESNYNAGLNHMPAIPSHIEPGGQSRLGRLPAFVARDYGKKMTSVKGHLLISCKDTFAKTHEFKQKFLVFTRYTSANPSVEVTFGDILQPDDA